MLGELIHRESNVDATSKEGHPEEKEHNLHKLLGVDGRRLFVFVKDLGGMNGIIEEGSRVPVLLLKHSLDARGAVDVHLTML